MHYHNQRSYSDIDEISAAANSERHNPLERVDSFYLKCTEHKEFNHGANCIQTISTPCVQDYQNIKTILHKTIFSDKPDVALSLHSTDIPYSAFDDLASAFENKKIGSLSVNITNCKITLHDLASLFAVLNTKAVSYNQQISIDMAGLNHAQEAISLLTDQIAANKIKTDFLELEIDDNIAPEVLQRLVDSLLSTRQCSKAALRIIAEQPLKTESVKILTSLLNANHCQFLIAFNDAAFTKKQLLTLAEDLAETIRPCREQRICLPHKNIDDEVFIHFIKKIAESNIQNIHLSLKTISSAIQYYAPSFSMNTIRCNYLSTALRSKALFNRQIKLSSLCDTPPEDTVAELDVIEADSEHVTDFNADILATRLIKTKNYKLLDAFFSKSIQFKPENVAYKNAVYAAMQGIDTQHLIMPLVMRGANIKVIDDRGYSYAHNIETLFYRHFPFAYLSLKFMLKNRLLDLNNQEGVDNKSTPLHILFQSDHQHAKRWHIAKLMMEHGANINIEDADGVTPLCSAVKNGFVTTESLPVFLAHGANFCHESNGIPLLHVAIYNNVQCVIDHITKHVVPTEKWQSCSIPSTLSSLDIADLYHTFLRGGDINSVDANKNTALHLIADELPKAKERVSYSLPQEFCEELIQLGANFDLENAQGLRPIDIVIKSGFGMPFVNWFLNSHFVDGYTLPITTLQLLCEKYNDADLSQLLHSSTAYLNLQLILPLLARLYANKQYFKFAFLISRTQRAPTLSLTIHQAHSQLTSHMRFFTASIFSHPSIFYCFIQHAIKSNFFYQKLSETQLMICREYNRLLESTLNPHPPIKSKEIVFYKKVECGSWATSPHNQNDLQRKVLALEEQILTGQATATSINAYCADFIMLSVLANTHPPAFISESENPLYQHKSNDEVCADTMPKLLYGGHEEDRKQQRETITEFIGRKFTQAFFADANASTDTNASRSKQEKTIK